MFRLIIKPSPGIMYTKFKPGIADLNTDPYFYKVVNWSMYVIYEVER
jgi:hypothetical protein